MKKRLYNLLALPILILLFSNSFIYAQDITPAEDGDFYSFQVSDVFFEVDASFGAHLSSLMLGEKEILFNERSGTGYLWGSTFWHSPQSEWNWPPATVLDEEPYSGGIEGNSVILQSGTESNFHVSFTKTFFASSADTSVTIIYNINNNGSSAITLAPWEVTRVPAEGITFWPMGEGTVTGDLSEYTEIIDDIAWYGYKDSDIGSRKFFSDGADGWFAHLNEDSILFVKQFADVPSGDEAPGEGEIELWLTGDHYYIELENQGIYDEIPADYLSEYKVKWYARKIPKNITLEVGNKELVDFVESFLSDPIIQNPVAPITPDLIITPVIAHLIVMDGVLSISELPMGQFMLEIFDLSGKLVQSVELQAENENIVHLNEQAPGIYIYRLSGNKYLGTGKLVIQ
jgi:hypothetical protein